MAGEGQRIAGKDFWYRGGRSTSGVVLNIGAAEFSSANKSTRPSQWTTGSGRDLRCKIDPGKRNTFNFYRATNRVL